MQELNKLTKYLTEASFVFAKTMPQHPHYYTLRKTWCDDESFVWCVNKIRQYGKKEFFFKKPYIVFYANGYKYWTMGCPTHNCNKTGTILINRAKVEQKCITPKELNRQKKKEKTH